MEKLINETSKEVVKNEYVRLSEMKKEEILKLDRFIGNLTVTEKKGRKTFRLLIQFDRLLTVTIFLTETEFNLICVTRKLKLNHPIQTIQIPVRLIEGITESGNEWKRYELFLTSDLRKSDFFSSTENALMKAANIKLNFIESPEKFTDDQLTVAFDQTIFD